MRFEQKAREAADKFEGMNSHFSAIQIADMVFTHLVGEWTGSEADKRSHALIRRSIGGC